MTTPEHRSPFAGKGTYNQREEEKKEMCNFCGLESCGGECQPHDPPAAFACDCCGDPVRLGDDYWKTGSGLRYCDRCIRGGTVEWEDLGDYAE